MFVHLACHRWSTNLSDMDPIEENELGGCQRWKLFFVVPGWYMPYFHLLPFVNNEQYGEGEMSQAIVFVYVFAFIFALTLSLLESCCSYLKVAFFWLIVRVIFTIFNINIPFFVSW